VRPRFGGRIDDVIPWLRTHTPFPPIDTALSDPNGLLAAGADLSPERLVEAYRNGIFPWYAQGDPVLWWSPDPRMVLFVDEFRVRRSLAKVLRARRFEIRVDCRFRDVMVACATASRPGQYGTWITGSVIDAYCALHQRGLAHSVEAWKDGTLAGGLYGVAIGRMFFGESMFARENDASKVALANLVAILRLRKMPMIDCQQETAHLATLGARPIPRRAFADRLAALIHSEEASGPWQPPPVDVLA